MASKKQANKLSESLQSKLSELEITRRRMDKLFVEKRIYTKDIEHVYEGMFLKAVTAFETYIEELFVGLLTEKYTLSTRKRVGKLTFKDINTATDVIFFGQRYVDWMPFEKLRKRADVFYHDGKPFTILTQQEKGILDQIFTIRNAIAHKSNFSQTAFLKNVVQITRGLPINHQTPAGYLRYVFRSSPNQTKFENYVYELSGIATKIAAYN